MTAYLLTPAQHAQIVDALDNGIKWLNICDEPRECIPLHRALAMLRAMKHSEPVGFTDSRGRFFYKNDPWMIQDHSGMPALYTLGDEE